MSLPPRGVAAQAVDGLVAGGAHQPADRLIGHAVHRPALQRGDDRLLERILGELEVAPRTAHQERQHLGASLPHQLGQERLDVGAGWAHLTPTS